MFLLILVNHIKVQLATLTFVACYFESKFAYVDFTANLYVRVAHVCIFSSLFSPAASIPL